MALVVNSPEISIVNKISVSPSKSLKTVSLLKKDETPLLISRVKVAYNLNRTVKLHTQFSVPVIKEATKRTKEEEADEDKQNYYVNMGYAIRTLREDFPDLFYRELTFDIYREDIVFKDPFNTFAGIENYKSIFWALRFHGRLFFRALWIDIISVWQPMENVIMVRWTVHGIPRVPWESRARFDGTSEYKLDRKGKIFEHQVHNIALNSPPKFRVRAVEDLIQSIGCPSTPKPTYFEVSSSSSEVD